MISFMDKKFMFVEEKTKKLYFSSLYEAQLCVYYSGFMDKESCLFRSAQICQEHLFRSP